jgi:hypothetical protein
MPEYISRFQYFEYKSLIFEHCQLLIVGTNSRNFDDYHELLWNMK